MAFDLPYRFRQYKTAYVEDQSDAALWTAHKNSPKLENGFGGHQPISGMAKQPTKNAVFFIRWAYYLLFSKVERDI